MERLILLNKIIIISLIVILFLAGLIILSFINNNTILINNQKYLYADNLSAVFFKITYINPVKQFITPFKGDYKIAVLSGSNLINIIKSQNGFFLKSKYLTGVVDFTVKVNQNIFNDQIIILDNYNDTDFDGFPDAVELTSERDRANFINWFTVIADSQFYCLADSWYEGKRDCAGLVVFAFKEALKKHDTDWLREYSFITLNNMSDVEKYTYPDLPLLGDKVFRTKSGKFVKEDLENNVFNETSDVNNLVNHNMKFISKDIHDIKKGDLLFFCVNDNIPTPYHSMIFLGKGDYLVYHTGQIDENNAGEVRKVKLSDLMKHPDSNWHPVKDNPSFLGIYRWNIII